MKKLKQEAGLCKAALLAGVQYTEGRKAVEFELTDSARRRFGIGSRPGMRINCLTDIRCWNRHRAASRSRVAVTGLSGSERSRAAATGQSGSIRPHSVAPGLEAPRSVSKRALACCRLQIDLNSVQHHSPAAAKSLHSHLLWHLMP